MVEMLGTLAIMGVLTIGGIAGYRYAINKSNANTILGAVSQMAVTASTELTTQGSLTLPEWKDANGNLSISGAFGVTTAQNNDGTFSIIVSNMNDEVCERIKGMDWKVPEDVAINGESDSCDQGEANAIAFVFSNTLNAIEHRREDGKCAKGYTGNNCTDKIECENGGKWTTEGCECPEGWYGPACDSNCNGLKNSSGTCMACSTGGGIQTTGAECSKCDNTDYPREMIGNNCVRQQCDTNQFRSSTGWCYACYDRGSITTTEKECAKCSTQRWYDSSNGFCRQCDSMIGGLPQEACKTCTQGYYFTGADGLCYGCSVNHGVAVDSKESCADCTGNSRRFMASDGLCHWCYESGGISVDSLAETNTSCGEKYYRFLGADGKAYKCEFLTPPTAVNTDCASSCTYSYQRRFTGSDNMCYYCTYPEPVPVKNQTSCVNSCAVYGSNQRRFMGIDGNCYICSYKGDVAVKDKAACTTCNSGFTSRVYDATTGLCKKK
ncbi:MAG: hypothetical protein IJV07_06000, partial [Alphaproteobacteria bacterium]|nr:hypothetical protein [Alphaproteobacteria bacterium]